MKRGKAFLLVGHKQWGKSRTLRALTDDRHQVRRVSIAGNKLFIRRMSNDDDPRGFRECIQALRPAQNGDAIIAFCPVFEHDANAILQDLEKHYDIHSFVLKRSFAGERLISEDEIAALHRFGPVQVFDRCAEAPERAAVLRTFVEQHLGR